MSDINSLVLEELSRELLQPSNPKELLEFMSDIKYDNTTPDKDYIIKSPKELLLKKEGVCYDEVELERLYFKKWNYDFKTYLAYILPLSSNPTHTFLIFRSNGKYYWFENSWQSYRGIHGSFNSYTTATHYVSIQLKKLYKWKYINIVEYQSPEVKLHLNEFAKYIIDNSEKLSMMKF